MRAGGLSYLDICQKLGVSTTTVAKWVREIEIRHGERPQPKRETRPTHPELAPARSIYHKRCLDNWGKPLCPVYYECRVFTDLELWALCEAPDDGDLARAEALAIDYRAYIERVREKLNGEVKSGNTGKQEGQTASQGGKERKVRP